MKKIILALTTLFISQTILANKVQLDISSLYSKKNAHEKSAATTITVAMDKEVTIPSDHIKDVIIKVKASKNASDRLVDIFTTTSVLENGKERILQKTKLTALYGSPSNTSKTNGDETFKLKITPKKVYP